MDAHISKNKALEQLTAARRIVDTTYPLVHEPKLFLPVIEYIYEALDISMNSYLESKNISFDKDNFQSKIDLFSKELVSSGLNIDKVNETTKFIVCIKKTLDEHKDAAVEFIRDEKFVISDNDYNMTMLSLNSVNDILSKAENYIENLY